MVSIFFCINYQLSIIFNDFKWFTTKYLHVGADTVVDLDTDEENDAVNKIRNEITKAIKMELKDELKQISNR